MHWRPVLTPRGLAVGAAVGALALATTTTATAGASTITLQNGVNGYTGADDATLFLDRAGKNYGGYDKLRAHNYKDFGSSRGEDFLIRFDLGSVTAPSGQALQSATLTMVKVDDASDHSSGTSDVEFRRLLKDWVEGTSSGGTTSGVTWDNPDQSNPSLTWSSGGARGDATDRIATPTATTAVPGGGQNPSLGGSYDWDVTDNVRAFLDGTEDNHGWQVENTGSGFSVIFASSESGSTQAQIAKRPKLTLTFAAVPEPASLGLIGVGGLLLASRRRRRA